MPIQPCTQPLTVTVEDDLVLLEGCGVAVTLTPPAAIATGDDLLDGATKAFGPAAVASLRGLRPKPS